MKCKIKVIHICRIQNWIQKQKQSTLVDYRPFHTRPPPFFRSKDLQTFPQFPNTSFFRIQDLNRNTMSQPEEDTFLTDRQINTVSYSYFLLASCSSLYVNAVFQGNMQHLPDVLTNRLTDRLSALNAEVRKLVVPLCRGRKNRSSNNRTFSPVFAPHLTSEQIMEIQNSKFKTIKNTFES